MEVFYFSPMLLGVNLLVAVAVAATALWFMARPIAGPGFWMVGAWTLILGVFLFIGFVLTRNPVLNVLGNALQLAGEAIFLLGVFRFIGRPLPYWIVPASVLLMVVFNLHYWATAGNSDFLMTAYSLIAGLLPVQAVWELFRQKDDPATRPARLLVGTCLAVYSIVTLLRAWFAWQAYASGEPYTQPYESFSYLLPYNFAIPALVMGFIGMTLMTMQRILAVSHTHATRAQQSALRFERLLQASSAGVAVLKDGKLLDANGQLELLTGLSRDELLGQTFENLFPKKVKEKLIDIMNLADGRQSDVDLCVGDNCVLPIEIRMMPFSELGGADLVVELRDISHRRALEDELKHMATIDPLTGALNRRSFNDLFELNVKRLTRYPSPMCLAMLDIDHFKAVNDIQGHQAGDEALRQFSALCQSRARATDIFARFGGEEFMLLMPDTNLEGAGIILQRLLEGVADLKIHGASGTFGFHASVGLTDYRSGDTLENLLKRADQALYRAKREGRNRISYEAAELAV